jgi:hypothetical protein
MIDIGSDPGGIFENRTVTYPNACPTLNFGDVQERKGGRCREEGGQAAAV